MPRIPESGVQRTAQREVSTGYVPKPTSIGGPSRGSVASAIGKMLMGLGKKEKDLSYLEDTSELRKMQMQADEALSWTKLSNYDPKSGKVTIGTDDRKEEKNVRDILSKVSGEYRSLHDSLLKKYSDNPAAIKSLHRTDNRFDEFYPNKLKAINIEIRSKREFAKLQADIDSFGTIISNGEGVSGHTMTVFNDLMGKADQIKKVMGDANAKLLKERIVQTGSIGMANSIRRFGKVNGFRDMLDAAKENGTFTNKEHAAMKGVVDKAEKDYYSRVGTNYVNQLSQMKNNPALQLEFSKGFINNIESFDKVTDEQRKIIIGGVSSAYKESYFAKGFDIDNARGVSDRFEISFSENMHKDFKKLFTVSKEVEEKGGKALVKATGKLKESINQMDAVAKKGRRQIYSEFQTGRIVQRDSQAMAAEKMGDHAGAAHRRDQLLEQMDFPEHQRNQLRWGEKYEEDKIKIANEANTPDKRRALVQEIRTELGTMSNHFLEHLADNTGKSEYFVLSQLSPDGQNEFMANAGKNMSTSKLIENFAPGKTVNDYNKAIVGMLENYSSADRQYLNPFIRQLSSGLLQKGVSYDDVFGDNGRIKKYLESNMPSSESWNRGFWRGFREREALFNVPANKRKAIISSLEQPDKMVAYAMEQDKGFFNNKTVARLLKQANDRKFSSSDYVKDLNEIYNMPEGKARTKLIRNWFKEYTFPVRRHGETKFMINGSVFGAREVLQVIGGDGKNKIFSLTDDDRYNIGIMGPNIHKKKKKDTSGKGATEGW